MSFFKKSIDNLENVEIPEIKSNALDYNEVLNYLVALPDDDYEKLLKVTNIYRRTERQVADILNPANIGTLEVAEKPAPKQNSEDPELDEVIEGFLETNEAKGGANNG